MTFLMQHIWSLNVTLDILTYSLKVRNTLRLSEVFSSSIFICSNRLACSLQMLNSDRWTHKFREFENTPCDVFFYFTSSTQIYNDEKVIIQLLNQTWIKAMEKWKNNRGEYSKEYKFISFFLSLNIFLIRKNL